MDKKALQTYAVWAKTNLETQVEISLKTLGINSEKDIKTARIVGEYTIIDDDMNSYPADLKAKRDRLINVVKTDGYKQVIEEVAYTWFNRIVALRFMEVHNFLPHGFRVLSNTDGGIEPEIMKNLNLVAADLKIDVKQVTNLMNQGKIDEAYRNVLFRQCKALADILPMLFEKDDDYLELLLPKALLKGETVITKLLEIGEDAFLNDVEVIGWLYQFYISQTKKEVFASKKTITKDTLPAVTQLFTPDWIVRYMAENSVGRVWLESYPDSELKSEMKYYVQDAKQEPDVQTRIDAIKYKNVNLEDLRIIEPCCGSGHILVYVFDLLYKMYEEKGYSAREIPTLILSKNLVGLEIDKRAAQLSAFALVMKARSINNRFFNDNYYVEPQVYEIWDSRVMLSFNYESQLRDLKLLTESEIKNIKWLVETFRYAKTIGSLLKVEKKDLDAIEQSINAIDEKAVSNIFNLELMDNGIKCLRHLLAQARVMSAKYDVMITNPPYIGISTMESVVKDYACKYYPDSKTDMFAMFMETGFVKPNGFTAIINMQSWMFLSSYEKLRKKIIMNSSIVNMVHLGAHAFEEIGGEVVQTTSFVIRNTPIAGNGVYFRLVDSKNKEQDFIDNLTSVLPPPAQIVFSINIKQFELIPGNVIAYWACDKVFDIYNTSCLLSEFVETRNGFTTGNNDLFLRQWFEVGYNEICFDATDYIYALYTGKTWFPYNKGGNFRKWYGNQDYIIDWKQDGKRVKEYGHLVPRSMTYMFFESIAWSKISSGSISFRLFPKGFMFDVAGLSMFIKTDANVGNAYILAFINSVVTKYFLSILSPTLNYEVGQIANLPVIMADKQNIDEIVEQNIYLSKEDWDSFETSWDFKKHPLI